MRLFHGKLVGLCHHRPFCPFREGKCFPFCRFLAFVVGSRFFKASQRRRVLLSTCSSWDKGRSKIGVCIYYPIFRGFSIISIEGCISPNVCAYAVEGSFGTRTIVSYNCGQVFRRKGLYQYRVRAKLCGVKWYSRTTYYRVKLYRLSPGRAKYFFLFCFTMFNGGRFILANQPLRYKEDYVLMESNVDREWWV